MIVADDLTGAADAAAPFWSSGARVLLDLETLDGALPAVVSASTGSRETTPVRAGAAVAAVVGSLRATLGAETRWFKKVDSTLHGHVGVEVDAMRVVLGDDLPVVACPAFPAWGRTVVDGELVVAGREPVSVARALDPGGSVARLSLEVVREGAAAIVDALAACDADRIVVDAVTDDDLDHLAEALHRALHPMLPVGAGGLTAALARTTPSGPTRCAPSPRTPLDPVLVIVGSRQRVSHDQVAALRDRADVAVVRLPTDDVPAWPRRLERLVAGSAPVTVAIAEPRSAGVEVAARLVSDGFAAAVAHVVGGGGTLPKGLVLVGGEVAAAVLAATRVTAIDLTGEVEPGLPAGTLLGGPLAGAQVVTKAGGFGHAGSLAAVLDRFRTTSEV